MSVYEQLVTDRIWIFDQKCPTPTTVIPAARVDVSAWIFWLRPITRIMTLIVCCWHCGCYVVLVSKACCGFSSECELDWQKEPQKSVIRGRCRSSATLGHGNMASDVAEIWRQSPGYQYQSQWIHPDMSLEHPNTQNQPRTAARVTDGEIMNILWLLMMFIL